MDNNELLNSLLAEQDPETFFRTIKGSGSTEEAEMLHEVLELDRSDELLCKFIKFMKENPEILEKVKVKSNG